MSSFLSWTLPSNGSHPRIWLNPSTKATFTGRIAGSHSAMWGAFQVHSEILIRRAGFPDSYFLNQEAELCASLAFSFLLDSSRTDHALRAQEIGLFLANQPWSPGAAGRHRMLAIALIYDWLFDYLTPNLRRIFLSRIAHYVERFYLPDPSEKIWGSSLGNSGFAMTALAAIVNEGTPEENSEWKGWLDFLFDAFDRGPADQTTFLAPFRYFGEIDGGCHLGAGPFGYDSEAEEIFGRLFPAMNSALGVAWETSEAWWDKLADWKIWHWRGDRSFHRQGEHRAPAPYSLRSLPHLLQTASRQNNTLGRNCQWLVDEILDARNQAPGGEHWLWHILWRDVTRASEKPTVATTGGGKQLRTFSRAGKAVIRTDWEPSGTSMTIEVPRFFLGGHSRRRAGHFNLATQGVPILYEKGHLDLAQELTYQVPSDSVETGHRFTYAQRIPAANVVRIFDTDEPAENVAGSFQRLPFSDARYGVLQGDGAVAVSNDGGQKVPKSGVSQLAQPENLQALLASTPWDQFLSWLILPHDETGFCHAVFDLSLYYYNAKVTTCRRHFLWVKPGAIPGWKYPAIIVYDDLVAHVDAVKGAKTCVLQLQPAAAPTGPTSLLKFDRGAARLFDAVLKPTSPNYATPADFDIEGTSFPATGVEAYDDPAGVRVEIWPTASGTAQQFVQVLFPCPGAIAAPPSVAIIDDATFIGATIGGIACKMTKAAPFTAQVASSTDFTAPGIVGGLVATPRRDVVDLSWTASGASDLDFYRVYRGTVSGGPYTLIADGLTTTTYRDYAVTNGTTYYYVIAAVDTSGNQSVNSLQASATPATGIQGPSLVTPPVRLNRGRRMLAGLRRKRLNPRSPYA